MNANASVASQGSSTVSHDLPAPADEVSAAQLRDQLMAPEPMQRIKALHLLELTLEECAADHPSRLAHEAQRFAERGIPYYDREDRHFQDWVRRAVSYWERLQGARRSGPASALAG